AGLREGGLCISRLCVTGIHPEGHRGQQRAEERHKSRFHHFSRPFWNARSVMDVPAIAVIPIDRNVPAVQLRESCVTWETFPVFLVVPVLWASLCEDG